MLKLKYFPYARLQNLFEIFLIKDQFKQFWLNTHYHQRHQFCERHLLSFWRYVWTTPYNCIALFLIGTKNGNVDGTRKPRLMGCVI